MKQEKFLRSAAILTAGSLLAKAIGACYRIPLSNLLGGYGMGLYQMAYPLYCVMLTFSSSGIPAAFARMIARENARGRDSFQTLKTALKLFALLGLFGTAVMCLLAPRMSAVQGDGKLLFCYLMLAPAVFLVSLIAVFRGYFQGKNDMTPTAVSEIVEQLVKAVLGVFFALRFRDDPARAVGYCLLSVTVSEAFALLYLSARIRGEGGRRMLSAHPVTGVEVLFSALPVMAAASLLPLSQTLDSIAIVRLLSGYTPEAVALYGLFSGSALSLVNLPAAVSGGFAAASVPSVSECFARGEVQEGKDRALYALGLTLLLAVPSALGLFFLANPIARLLYPRLSGVEADTLVRLIKLLSVSAVSIAGTGTLASCLTGMGRAKYAAFSMLIAVTVKFFLQWMLVKNPIFSIGGAAIAANACYLVAFFLDLYYTVRKERERKHALCHRIGRRSGRSRIGRIENVESGG